MDYGIAWRSNRPTTRHILAAAVSAGLLVAIATIKPLDILLLGEQYARTMGLNLRRSRMIIILSTTLLAGTVTAFCGPIGFIGLAMPHVAPRYHPTGRPSGAASRIRFGRRHCSYRLRSGLQTACPADQLHHSFGGHSGSHLGSIVQQILLRMIRFSNLTISHAPDKRLLAGASANIPAGSLCALIGRKRIRQIHIVAHPCRTFTSGIRKHPHCRYRSIQNLSCKTGSDHSG